MPTFNFKLVLPALYCRATFIEIFSTVVKYVQYVVRYLTSEKNTFYLFRYGNAQYD